MAVVIMKQKKDKLKQLKDVIFFLIMRVLFQRKKEILYHFSDKNARSGQDKCIFIVEGLLRLCFNFKEQVRHSSLVPFFWNNYFICKNSY